MIPLEDQIQCIETVLKVHNRLFPKMDVTDLEEQVIKYEIMKLEAALETLRSVQDFVMKMIELEEERKSS